MASNLTTYVVRTSAEIESIRPIWKAWAQHPNSDIEFFLAISRLRSSIIRPHIIMIRNNGRPEAMLIGRLEQGRIHCNVGYKTMFAPSVRTIAFVHGGLLGNWTREVSEAAFRELNNCLKVNEADVVRLNFIAADCPLASLMRTDINFARRDHFPTLQRHWAMKLPWTMDEMYSRLSSDHRSEIRRKSKRLLTDHARSVRVECIREVSEVERLCSEVESIAKITYQRGLGVGFIDDSETREILTHECKSGTHRTYLLYIEGRPCAFWMGNVYRGRFFSGNLGYDPKYERYSIGTYLLVKTVEELIKDRVGEIDFGLGDARYKQRFGNYSWEELSAFAFAPSVKAVVVNGIRTPALLIDRTLRGALRRTSLLARVKKVWRQRKRRGAKDFDSSHAREASVSST